MAGPSQGHTIPNVQVESSGEAWKGLSGISRVSSPWVLDEEEAQRGAVFCQMSHSWSGTEWDSNQVHGDLLTGTPVSCGDA